MAEGSTIKKFPDSWDSQHLWTVVTELLTDNYLVDILIKRLVHFPFKPCLSDGPYIDPVS